MQCCWSDAEVTAGWCSGCEVVGLIDHAPAGRVGDGGFCKGGTSEREGGCRGAAPEGASKRSARALRLTRCSLCCGPWPLPRREPCFHVAARVPPPQNPNVPQKTLECLRDLPAMYNTATVEDVRMVYEHFDFSDEGLFTCVGTSGECGGGRRHELRLANSQVMA
jgi:hypothetical protein